MSEQTRKQAPMNPIASEGAPALLLRLSQQLMVLLLAVFGFLFSLMTSYTLDLPTAKLALTALVTAEENVMFEIAHVCIRLVVIGFDCYQHLRSPPIMTGA